MTLSWSRLGGAFVRAPEEKSRDGATPSGSLHSDLLELSCVVGGDIEGMSPFRFHRSGLVRFMTCTLAQEDCVEIYHALGHVHARNLQLRIGYNGEGLANGEVILSKGEAQTVYRALTDRHERILRGAYDAYPGEVMTFGSITFELLEYVRQALAKIGFLGENLATESDRPLKTA